MDLDDLDEDFSTLKCEYMDLHKNLEKATAEIVSLNEQLAKAAPTEDDLAALSIMELTAVLTQAEKVFSMANAAIARKARTGTAIGSGATNVAIAPCVVCMNPNISPNQVSTCCGTMTCTPCKNRWQSSHNACLKCHAVNPSFVRLPDSVFLDEES